MTDDRFPEAASTASECDIRADAETAAAPANDLLAGYPRESNLPTIVAAFAAHRPAAPAIRVDAALLDYRELDERSNRLAHELAARGVGPRDVVGLYVQRSAETIIAMLAVLKCGAAYLPLDPSYPQDAIAYMIDNSAPRLVLAQALLLADDTRGVTAGFVSLEEVLAAAQARAASPVGVVPGPLDPAYVIYTSGSTGRPKGVVVPHRAIIRLVRQQNYVQLTADDVSLHVVSLTFDPSTLEIWGALLNGASVAVVPDLHPSLDRIGEVISRHNVTFANFATGVFHLLVDHDIEALRPIRTLMAGGDVLSPPHVRRVMEVLPQTQFVNAYGPSENTTVTCCYNPPRTGWGGGSVPIGVPVAHSYVHILDEQLQQVADGDVGQLCTGGDGLALGYMNRPDLTAERFIADPFSADPAARLYLTGDLVRRRPDGLIEFVGRNDRQVKINGKRIELDGIETMLRQDPQLRDAIIGLKQPAPEIKRIAAYIIPQEAAGGAFSLPALLERLGQHLPPHMLPHEFAIVDAFPLTVNGKVDRRQLEQIATHPLACQATAAETVPPTPVAAAGNDGDPVAVIAAIWAEELRHDGFGHHDNFFDLGGTSMELTSVHARLQRVYGPQLTLVQLFEHPTIASLAAFLADGGTGSAALDAARSRAPRLGQALQRLRQKQAGNR